MKLQSYQIITGASLLALADVSIAACGTVPPVSAKDKGNYYCGDCTGAGIEENIFIRSDVNQNIGGRWYPNQFVTITNGSRYTTMTYSAGGTFIPTATGSGYGPGTPVNHVAGSKDCTPPPVTSTGGGGGSSSGYYTGSTTPNYGTNPGYYSSVCYGCSYGNVYIYEG